MKFYVKKRDGPARIGELEINKMNIITPNIAYVNTNRFKAPNFAKIHLANENGKIDIPKICYNNKDERKTDHICIINPEDQYFNIDKEIFKV